MRRTATLIFAFCLAACGGSGEGVSPGSVSAKDLYGFWPRRITATGTGEQSWDNVAYQFAPEDDFLEAARGKKNIYYVYTPGLLSEYGTFTVSGGVIKMTPLSKSEPRTLKILSFVPGERMVTDEMPYAEFEDKLDLAFRERCPVHFWGKRLASGNVRVAFPLDGPPNGLGEQVAFAFDGDENLFALGAQLPVRQVATTRGSCALRAHSFLQGDDPRIRADRAGNVHVVMRDAASHVRPNLGLVMAAHVGWRRAGAAPPESRKGDTRGGSVSQGWPRRAPLQRQPTL